MGATFFVDSAKGGKVRRHVQGRGLVGIEQRWMGETEGGGEGERRGECVFPVISTIITCSPLGGGADAIVKSFGMCAEQALLHAPPSLHPLPPSQQVLEGVEADSFGAAVRDPTGSHVVEAVVQVWEIVCVGGVKVWRPCERTHRDVGWAQAGQLERRREGGSVPVWGCWIQIDTMGLVHSSDGTCPLI